MASGPRVFVLGDVNVDAMARLESPLTPGADNIHRAFELQLGGVGANVAVALANCGADVRLASCVGRDWLGEFATEALKRQRVDTQFLAQADGVTGLVVIPVDPDGRRTILGARGANGTAPAGEIGQWLDGVDAVHLVGYTLLSEHTARLPAEVAREASRRGIAVSFDPAPWPCASQRERVREMLPLVTTLLVGFEEAEALTGQRGSAALEAIAQCGAAEVIVKRGEGGSQFFEAARWWAMPPFAVQSVDTTGAGDAFAAGYIWAKLSGWPVADCVLMANAVGAAATSRLGAGEAMPGVEDVRQLLAGVASDQTEAKLAARLLRLLSSG